jgi:anti-sigma-K factor RskA
MNVDRETLMAYADGELDEVMRRRVEQAIAADPELARQLDAERALRARLQAHFAPVADEPVPEAWKNMIAAARADAVPAAGNVASLDVARAKRSMRLALPRRGVGFAIAASLALGVALGTQLRQDGPVVLREGRLQASAELASALDTQLASQHGERGLRMLATFRRASGDYCRVFSGDAVAGVACREGRAWKLERVLPGGADGRGDYRQAGSAEAELMAAAQEMAAGDPLDAAQEAAARDRGWRR